MDYFKTKAVVYFLFRVVLFSGVDKQIKEKPHKDSGGV